MGWSLVNDSLPFVFFYPLLPFSFFTFLTLLFIPVFLSTITLHPLCLLLPACFLVQALVRVCQWWLSSLKEARMWSQLCWSTSGTHLPSLWWCVMAAEERQTSWPSDTNILRREGMRSHVLIKIVSVVKNQLCCVKCLSKIKGRTHREGSL